MQRIDLSLQTVMTVSALNSPAFAPVPGVTPSEGIKKVTVNWYWFWLLRARVM